MRWSTSVIRWQGQGRKWNNILSSVHFSTNGKGKCNCFRFQSSHTFLLQNLPTPSVMGRFGLWLWQGTNLVFQENNIFHVHVHCPEKLLFWYRTKNKVNPKSNSNLNTLLVWGPFKFQGTKRKTYFLLLFSNHAIEWLLSPKTVFPLSLSCQCPCHRRISGRGVIISGKRVRINLNSNQ
jgi:hypothetical protein